MSFFYAVKNDKNNSLFLWIFAFFLAIGCAGIHTYEENEKPQTAYEHNRYYGVWTKEGVRMEEGIPKRQELPVMKEKDSLDNLQAGYAVLMDGTNGRVLYEKNGYEKAPMASTTKIMTLIVALENGNGEDLVTVSSNAARQPDVKLHIQTGEQYRLKDLLYSMILESHNDSAVAIAEHIGGSVEGFAKMMNDKAKQLGAYDTNFVTPNGLDAKKHYTTARDLALIARYCLSNRQFCEMIQTRTYQFHEQTKGRSLTVNNKNRFLDLYEGAIGIKTGFTGKAGYCFVGGIEKEGKKLISVVLACGWPPHKNYKWQDTTRLMNYGINEYTKKTVVEKNISFQKIKIQNGIQYKECIPYTKDRVSLLVKGDDRITYDVCIPKTLEAPVKKNQNVGILKIYINGKEYQDISLYSDVNCEKITYQYCFLKILKSYINGG